MKILFFQKTLFYLFLFSNIYINTSAKFKRDRWPREYLGQESPRWFFGGGILVKPLDSNGYSGYFNPAIAYRAGNRSIFILQTGVNYYQEKIYKLSINWGDLEFYKYKEANYEVSLAWRYFYYWRFFTHIGVANYNVKKLTNFYYDYLDEKVVEEYARENIFAAPCGLGYVQPIGENSSIVFTALYDIIQNPLSPYRGKPIFRAGFNFGL